MRETTKNRIINYAKIFLIELYLILLLAMNPTVADYFNYPKSIDFMAFYAASNLVLMDQPASLYNFNKLYDLEKKLTHGNNANQYPWYYPPTFLLMLLPLAYMPYYASLCLWLGATFLGFIITAYCIIANASVIWVVLVFPGALINFLHGQNGFFSATLLGGGLLLLEERPALAGVFFGLLSYKPQFGILIPFALIAGRYWKTISSAFLTAIFLVLLSLLMFGSETWLAFFSNMKGPLSLIEQGAFKLWKMPTVFAGTMLLINNIYIARLLQCILFTGSVLVLFFTWRNQRIPRSLRSSLLVILTLLSTPYLFDYDLTILLLPILWLGCSPYLGKNLLGNRIILMSGYCMPVVASVVANATRLQIGPLILMGLLWLTFNQIKEYKKTSNHTCYSTERN